MDSPAHSQVLGLMIEAKGFPLQAIRKPRSVLILTRLCLDFEIKTVKKTNLLDSRNFILFRLDWRIQDGQEKDQGESRGIKIAK
jgi:hypothetical protein